VPGSSLSKHNTTPTLAFATIITHRGSPRILPKHFSIDLDEGTTVGLLCHRYTRTHHFSRNLLVPVYGCSQSGSYVRQFPIVTSACIVVRLHKTWTGYWKHFPWEIDIVDIRLLEVVLSLFAPRALLVCGHSSVCTLPFTYGPRYFGSGAELLASRPRSTNSVSVNNDRALPTHSLSLFLHLDSFRATTTLATRYFIAHTTRPSSIHLQP
jgi:hypothetical protein